jgi:SWI/SNF-related matrix-associated actin-dependent regulator of chromatin subfamily A-like protein 1
MKPLPHQVSGAKFLSDRWFAILADAPRVGKTGAAIMAADRVSARNILVVTTASGRAVWKKGFADWSPLDRKTQIATPKDRIDPEARVVIVGWPSIADPKLRTQLLSRPWDVAIFDEAHYAKNFEAKRTQAAFGVPSGHELVSSYALAGKAERVWCLTGTPMPNSPFDLYPMLRFGAPHRLGEYLAEYDFKKRYCVIKPKKIGHGAYARYIDVVIGGRNLPELRERIGGLLLLRTQQDVGIREPIYETLPLIVSETNKRKTETGLDAKLVLGAIERGDTKTLEMHLGPLRRLTGEIKARAVIDALADEFDCGLDKIVLAAWHHETMAILRDGLSQYGVVGIDGRSSPTDRERAVAEFSRPDGPKVFIGQIKAAGEAIDLSAASELLFVETSFVPADMKQMSLRITNHKQTRQARVRVATLDGSIDDAVQASLLRKWSAIREVLTQ